MKNKNAVILEENKNKILESLGFDYLTAQDILKIVFGINPCTFAKFNGENKYCNGKTIAPILQSLVCDCFIECKFDKMKNKTVYRKKSLQ